MYLLIKEELKYIYYLVFKILSPNASDNLIFLLLEVTDCPVFWTVPLLCIQKIKKIRFSGNCVGQLEKPVIIKSLYPNVLRYLNLATRTVGLYMNQNTQLLLIG